MSKKLRALLERKQQALAAANAINKKAETDQRELTDEERTQLDAHVASITQVNGDIERQRQLDTAEASMTGVDITGGPASVGNAEPRLLQDPRRGYAHFGQFANDVMTMSQPGGAPSERFSALQAAAPSTYGSEGVGQDGGFLVPPEFSSEILTHSLEQESLLALTADVPVNGNGMTFPKDETTPWGTDGVRGYWQKEAGVATATKPKGGMIQMRLHKLFALVPVTDEMLEDVAALPAYLAEKMGDSIRWKANDALVNGNGDGQPLGILQANSLVSVAKEAAQAADTVKIENIAKMFARMPGGSIGNARWLINNDVLPQLITMVLNNQPIFQAPGALPNAPAGLLLGRPIMITQHCQTLGDKGDICFVDWKKYRTISKRSGIQVASSIHLYFDAGATAFRSTFRIDGQPAVREKIVPARGGNDLSYYVTLDERA